MAAQALYRRWRPQTFEDVVGQNHIVQTLRNAIGSGRLAHAYMLTGPRGTGKTSVARILAKAINCTGPVAERPCNACAICISMTEGRALDLIEIDAASNTGVDDVRDLRDKIGFSPAEARYKVYIIDEVHMLSTAAFNALLKTLEEPPPHAVFILATTEPHKIPDTILSRCQRHDFRRHGVALTTTKLERICAAEGIDAERTALELVARAATGSMRDAESLLDQLIATGEAVTLEAVQEVLGVPAGDVVAGLVDAVVDRDGAAGLRLINGALDRGTDPRQFQNQILGYLRGLLVIQTGVDTDLLAVADEQLARMRAQAGALSMAELVAMIHRFNEARPAADRALPSLPLELALVETILAASGAASGAAAVAAAVAAAAGQAGAPAPAVRSASTSTSPSTPNVHATPAPVERTLPSKNAPLTPAQAPASNKRQGAAPTTASERATTDRAAATAHADAGDTSDADGAPAMPAPTLAGDPDVLARLQGQWEAFVAEVDRRDRNTGALLKDCRPVAADGTSVTLGFFFDFHCRRVSEPDRKALVADALAHVLGAKPAVRCVVVSSSNDEQATRPKNKTDQAKSDPVVRHAIESLGAQIAGVQSDDLG